MKLKVSEKGSAEVLDAVRYMADNYSIKELYEAFDKYNSSGTRVMDFILGADLRVHVVRQYLDDASSYYLSSYNEGTYFIFGDYIEIVEQEEFEEMYEEVSG